MDIFHLYHFFFFILKKHDEKKTIEFFVVVFFLLHLISKCLIFTTHRLVCFIWSLVGLCLFRDLLFKHSSKRVQKKENKNKKRKKETKKITKQAMKSNKNNFFQWKVNYISFIVQITRYCCWSWPWGAIGSSGSASSLLARNCPVAANLRFWNSTFDCTFLIDSPA